MTRYEIVVHDSDRARLAPGQARPWGAELFETDADGQQVTEPLLAGTGESVSAAVLDLLNAMEDDDQGDRPADVGVIDGTAAAD